MSDGSIYLIQLKEFYKNNVNMYKLEKDYTDDGSYIDKYGYDSKPIFYIAVNNVDKCYKNLRLLFRIRFLERDDYGKKFFHGNPEDMIDTITDYIKEFRKKESQDEPELPPFGCESYSLEKFMNEEEVYERNLRDLTDQFIRQKNDEDYIVRIKEGQVEEISKKKLLEMLLSRKYNYRNPRKSLLFHLESICCVLYHHIRSYNIHIERKSLLQASSQILPDRICLLLLLPIPIHWLLQRPSRHKHYRDDLRLCNTSDPK